jgi:hypothetical protein
MANSGHEQGDAMSDFATFYEWVAACEQLGLRGPYRVAGPSVIWQFVDDNGSAAMWNAAADRGVVFNNPGCSANVNEAKE